MSDWTYEAPSDSYYCEVGQFVMTMEYDKVADCGWDWEIDLHGLLVTRGTAMDEEQAQAGAEAALAIVFDIMFEQAVEELWVR